MNGFDKLHLLAGLGESNCALNHGPETDGKRFKAVNYIVLQIGRMKNDAQETAASELTIPICHDCSQALATNEWTLLYCFECGNNRWVNRKLAKNNYRHHILWLKGCPDCTNKFNGLYFNDHPDTLKKHTDTLCQHSSLVIG